MGVSINPTIKILADLGFVGINKLHSNSEIPHKNTKNKPISKHQKKENSLLAKKRIAVEHVNRMLKIFNILNILTETSKNALV